VTVTGDRATTAPAAGVGNAAVELAEVRKSYGANTAVDGVSLRVRTGEFLTLLGPSGCGKTTILSMLAGFVTPDAGSVVIDGSDMTRVPPHRRPVNTVFQDYALFPHMSVADNVAFGLRMEKVSRKDARRRAREVLAGVDLESFAGHRVAALSGGQRQRVALARALVKQPKVLLLDEPFAALDLRLRQRMQLDLRRLHHDTGTTFVFVTHDQEEASVLSDRIAVLRDGKVEQVGSPEEIYDDPRTRFVAEFIGESNVFDATLSASGMVEVPALGQTLAAPGSDQPQGAVAYAVRPERVRVVAGGDAPSAHPAVVARVEEVMRAGEIVRVLARLDSGAGMAVATPAWSERVEPGQQVQLYWRGEDARVLAG
jgi:spermidine/putrescine ABC transporter ATP-binding subunit